jgi:hypothetical protein
LKVVTAGAVAADFLVAFSFLFVIACALEAESNDTQKHFAVQEQ